MSVRYDQFKPKQIDRIYLNHMKLLLEKVYLSFLYEGKLEDFYEKQKERFPDFVEQIEVLYNEQIPIQHFDWIIKQLKTTSEPIEDMIPVLKDFGKYSNALPQKNISKYANIAELTYAIQDYLERKQGKDLQKEKDKFQFRPKGFMDVLLHKDHWYVIMPNTTEESCAAGTSTAWCTARTESGNMFLNYTARDEDIILFYVIKDNVNPRKDVTAKMSVAFIEGKPVFDKGANGVTVKADNSNLTESEFNQIVGEENSGLFLNAMAQKAGSLDGQHPAKKEMKELASNYEAFKKKMDSYKETEQNYEAKKDFLETLREYYSHVMDDRVFSYIEKFQDNIKDTVDLVEDMTHPRQMEKYSTSLDSEIRSALALKGRLPDHLKEKFSNDSSEDVRVSLAKNYMLPIKLAVKLAKDENVEVRRALLTNTNFRPVPAHREKNLEFMSAVASELVKDSDERIIDKLADTENLDPEIYEALYENNKNDFNFLVALLTNISLPSEFKRKIVVNLSEEEKLKTVLNVFTDEETLEILSYDTNPKVLLALLDTPQTLETLQRLAQNENPEVATKASNIMKSKFSKFV